MSRRNVKLSVLAIATCAAACATAPAMDAAAGRATYGGFTVPEGATYDAEGDRYFVGNAAAFGAEANDGYISVLNADGSTHAARWVAASDAQELRNPLGVEAANGALYVVDTPYVRRFSLADGAALPPYLIEGAAVLNDLDVAADGTVYVTDMGTADDPASWKVMKVAPDGAVSTFAQGEALGRPNGLDIGPDGRIYLAPVVAANIVVLGTDGAVAETIALPGPSNDGIVVFEDSVLISQPFNNTIYRIAFDGTATILTDQATSAASIGYDPTRGVIVIPQLQQNAVSLLHVE
jgi:hypothetical protein